MKLNIAGILICLLLPAGCAADNVPIAPKAMPPLQFDSHFPVISDEGGAPAKVLLRVKGTPGKPHQNWHQTVYWDATSGLTAILDYETESQILSVQNGVITGQSTELDLVAERDDFHTAAKMRAHLVGHNFTYSLDPLGNLVKSSDPYAGVFYNFPTAPVGMGAMWSGSIWRHKLKLPLVFRVDKIIEHKRRVYVQLTATIPGTPVKDRWWLDVNTGGTAGHEYLDEVVLKNGHIFVSRSYSLPHPPSLAAAPAPTAAGPHLEW